MLSIGEMMNRKITRLYTGSDGESHFEEIEVPLKDMGERGRRSELIEVTGIIFMETDGNYFLDWHNVPHQQFSIQLEGHLEIEVGDGTRRRFGPGDVLLAEDTTGRGHISRAVNNIPRKNIFVILV